MSNFSNYLNCEDLEYRTEQLLMSNCIYDRRNKRLIPKCIIKKVSGSTVAFLDKKFFEYDLNLFYYLKEIDGEKQISELFVPAFKAVFKQSIDRVRVIK